MTLVEFLKYSRKIGKNPDLVQAGGGNISIKLGESKMLVKASGTELLKASKKKGHVMVNYGKISSFIEKISHKKHYKESDYIAALTQSIIAPKESSPSMETGFHAVLDKAVIHTHPVGINSIGCTKNAKKLLSQAFGNDFEWVTYKSPGAELSAWIFLQKQKTKRKVFIAILENHGLIVSSGSLKECYEKTIQFEKTAQNFLEKKGVKVHLPSNLRIKKINKNKVEIKELKDFMNNEKSKMFFDGFLFPDSAIYLESLPKLGKGPSKVNVYPTGLVEINEKNPKNLDKTLQVFYASLCTMANIVQFDTPKQIKKEKIDELQAMALEKIRKGVN